MNEIEIIDSAAKDAPLDIGQIFFEERDLF